MPQTASQRTLELMKRDQAGRNPEAGIAEESISVRKILASNARRVTMPSGLSYGAYVNDAMTVWLCRVRDVGVSGIHCHR